MSLTTKKQFWRAFLFGMILIHAWGIATAIQEVIVIDSTLIDSSNVSAMMMTDFIELFVVIALTVFVFALSNPILRRVGVRPFNNMNTKNIPLWKAGAVLLGCVGGLFFMILPMLLFGLLLSAFSITPIEYDSLTMRLFLYGVSLLTLFVVLEAKQRFQGRATTVLSEI